MTDNIENLARILKPRVTEKRYVHSLGVMEEAKMLAHIHKADEAKAEIAGLLHDITKSLSPEEHASLIKTYNPSADPTETKSNNLLHAVTAPLVLEHELNITDPEILSAVRFHTTARPKMSLLEKILFVSDFTEPNRDYPDVRYYRKIAREDLDKALFLGLRWGLKSLLKRGEYIYRNTWETYNYYITNFNTAAYVAAFETENGKET